MSSTSTSGASNATGRFQTSNGQIDSPNGNVFYAKGINLYDSEMGDAAQVLADFPGINFIRLNVYSYQSPSAYASFIQTMTSAGVVVELEDHTNSNGSNAGGGSGNAFTGSQLTNELNWYSSVASAYASNPYVWFGTDNEPPGGGLSAWEQQTYNAIRNTGNNNPIMIELPGGGDPGNTVTSYGMDPTVYTSMTNIIGDPHFYGWSAGYSTNQQTVNSALTALVQGVQTIQSANGTIPVIIGEYGPSTDGVDTDANASQVEQAVQQSTAISGSAAWGWDPGQNDDLTDGSGNLTSYGQEVAQWFASTPTVPTSTPTPTPTPASTPTPTPTPNVTPSANDTTVMAKSTAAITDASGNKWTITSSGLVAVNGTADTTTANVIELAYVNGTVWQENASDLWWGKTSPTASWSPSAGTSTSPLPATPTPTPAPTPTPTPAPTPTPTPTPTTTPSSNDTVVQGTNGVITDASGNKWTITSQGLVAVNGTADTTTANVIELAYVNGTVWQENASDLWWGKTSPSASWSPSAGTSTSPLPAVPKITASPNDTMVIAGSTAAITDASGNKWTITSGAQVAVNGTADTTTSTVTELAYVNGAVWQENSYNMWWDKTSPTASWAPTAGTSTSPLPATIVIAPGSTNAKVTGSEVSVAVTSGTNMLFISGSGDLVTLSGGTNTVTDTGSGNTYILPAAGKGMVTFASNILNSGDTLDLKPALAATSWNGATATLQSYLTVTSSSNGAVISLAATSGGTATAIASISGATTQTYSTLLTHAII